MGKKIKISRHKVANGKSHSSSSSSNKTKSSSPGKSKDRSRSNGNGSHNKFPSSGDPDVDSGSLTLIGSLTANFGDMTESAKQKYIKGGKYVVLRKLKRLEERYYLSWFEADESVIDRKIAQKWAAFPNDEKEEDKEDQKLKFPWITNLEVGLLKLGDDDKARQRHYVDRLFSLEILKGYTIERKSLKGKLENRRRALKTLHFSPKHKEIVYIPSSLTTNSREADKKAKAILDELNEYRFLEELPEQKKLPDDAKRVENTLAEHYDFIIDIIMIVHLKLPRCQITQTYKIVHGMFFNLSELFVRYVLRRCCAACRGFIKLGRGVSGVSENHKDKYVNRWNVYKTSKPFFKVFDDEDSDIGNDLNYYPSQRPINRFKVNSEESDIVEISDSDSDAPRNSDDDDESDDDRSSRSGSDSDDENGSGSESEDEPQREAADDEADEDRLNAGVGADFKQVSKTIIEMNTESIPMEAITIHLVDMENHYASSGIAKRIADEGEWEEIGYRYILHIQEQVSKFNFLYPLESEDGTEILNLLTFFFKTVFRPKTIVLLLDKGKEPPRMKTRLRDLHIKLLVEEYDSSSRYHDVTRYHDILLINNGDIIGRDSNLARRERKKANKPRIYMHLKTFILTNMTSKRESNWANLLPDISNFLNHYTYLLGDVRPVDLFYNYYNTRLALPFNGNPTHAFRSWTASELEYVNSRAGNSGSENRSDSGSDNESDMASDQNGSGSGSNNESNSDGESQESDSNDSDDGGSDNNASAVRSNGKSKGKRAISDSEPGSGSDSGSDSDSDGSGSDLGGSPIGSESRFVSGSESPLDDSSSEEVVEDSYRVRKRTRRR